MTMGYASVQLTPRQKRREVIFERILSTAMTLLDNDGVDGMTIGKLAAELDYTKGALYRYFSSKSALVAALQVRSLKRVHHHFTETWETARASLTTLDDRSSSLALILVTTRFYASLERELPADFALIRLVVGDSRQLLPREDVTPVMDAMLDLLQDVASLIRAAEETGALQPGDPLQRAVILWAGTHGNVLTGKFVRYDAELFAPLLLVDELTKTLLVGWGATPALLNLASDATEEMS
jgi:AcrR family transcriptional regulator